MIFLAETKPDGGISFGSDYNLARFKDWAKEKPRKIRIEEVISKRSASQNRLYWLYLGIIETETGNNANDLHEYFRRTLIEPKFIQVLGKELKIPKSTTELSKIDFGAYMEKIAALTEIPIPDVEAFNKYWDSAPMQNE